MDSKKIKRKKKETSIRTKGRKKVQSHEPEVFVLPPNILQKLGITLGKVESDQENSTSDTTMPEINIVKKSNTSENTFVVTQETIRQDEDALKDVSLMETAALMTNSVFLSPTFAPVTTTTIPDERDLLAIDSKSITLPITSSEPEICMDEEAVKNCNTEGKEAIINNAQDIFSTTSNLNCHSNGIVSDVGSGYNLFPTNTTFEVLNTDIPEEAITTDDHLDEAYLSDCSNSNSETVENVKKTIQTAGNGKKITIISEEILTPISSVMSLAGPVTRGTLIYDTASETHLNDTIKHNVLNLPLKSKMTPGRCYKSKNLANISILSNGTISEKDKLNYISEVDIHNDRLSDCIDISVTDIERNLKDNEEILQEFANEIISNDSRDIINKIETSEKLSEESYVKDLIHIIDRENTLFENDQLLGNRNELCFCNNASIVTSTQDILDKKMAKTIGVLTSIKHNNIGVETSKISKNEDNSYTSSKSDLSSKVENSIDVSLNDISTYTMSDTDKFKDNLMINNNDQKCKNHVHDRVEEISKYLKRCLNRTNTKFLRRANDLKEIYPRTLEHKDLKSNQGVEKPGGKEAEQQHSTRPKPIKTYEQASKKHKPKATIYPNLTYPEKNRPEISSTLLLNEPNAIPISFSTSRDLFCLCGDFGKMAFYDCDSPYKHIHFWEQKVFNIVPDLVYSIYNDHCSAPDPTDTNQNQENVRENDSSQMELEMYNICWNTIESESEIYKEKEHIDNEEKVQQELHSFYKRCTPFNQNAALVSDTKHKKCDIDNSTEEQRCIKQEKADHSSSDSSNVYKYGNTTRYIICVDAHSADSVNERNKCLDEQSQIEMIHSEATDEPDMAQCTANDATLQNYAAANDEMILQNRCQLDGSYELTNKLETQNVKKHITYDQDEAHKSVIERTKEIHKPAQARRFTFDEETDYDQESFVFIENNPGNTSESKQKNEKNINDPIRFNFEHDFEDDPEQTPKSRKIKTKKRGKSPGSDEEPLSVKKARKQKSIDNYGKSLESFNVSKSNDVNNITTSDKNKVQCGVCSEEVETSDWFEHIGKEHSYVAWKLGEPAVDVDNEIQFENHLKEILKQSAQLACSKCGLVRKYVKPYLKHFNQCESLVSVKKENETINSHDIADTTTDTVSEYELIKCGVCSEEVDSQQWMKHIQKAHDYLAWKQGEPLDLNDSDAVTDHLASIVKKVGQLICSKCGLKRRYVKTYLDHIKLCTSEHTEEVNDYDTTTGATICAVCKENVDPKKWNKHNMMKHYNLSWIKGEPPVVATSIYSVEQLLKEYKNKYKELVCTVCGASRVSYMGFYAHILVCGKSDEETEKYKVDCNICNKQYLFLYQSQHMKVHREQENAKERKKEAQIKKENLIMTKHSSPETPTGRRRAAEKARTVIEKYNDSTTATYKCDKCSFSTDLKKELDKHKCESNAAVDSDTEPFVVSESEDDSCDDVDSNVSDEEEAKCAVKKVRKELGAIVTAQSPMAKAKAFPCTVAKPKQYVYKSGEEHYKTYLTSKGLFPEWRNMYCQEVSEQEMPPYMPPIEESCKVKISDKVDGEWNTYKRFEAAINKDVTTVFVGASIQCACWASPRALDGRGERAFLAVALHRGADTPRFPANETRSHPALIQIWDFGNFKSLPKLVFGLAHDYGTVWSMDWCPSGARDAPDSDSSRLGLLATACSDGIVYIYSVPYPSANEDNNKPFYKIKPVVELRLSSASERKPYQATAVKWCKQIGHALIFVGYSDGITAYYDLNTESSLLRSTENGLTVLYPYYDERSHTSCVTGVSTFPIGSRAGVTISSAPSGVRVTSSPALRPRRRATHHAGVSADFEPLFPYAIFATDSSRLLASPPELDWLGAGRKLGSLSALAGCARCGLCLAHAAPHLRTMRPHPAYLETKKQNIGTLDMVSLGKKRKKPLKDDNLTTIVEPTTYEEAIKKYGIELKLDKNVRPATNSRQRDLCPERFPLTHPSSMVFCPAPAHHDRVAIATHSGVIFVFSISA